MFENKIKLALPRWVPVVYIFLSVIMIPWTIYIGTTLPVRHLSTHWDVSWAGLDIAMVVMLLATGLLAYFRSRWVVITASTLGGLLAVDAWFDVMSERRGLQLQEAIILAVFVELPLIIMSYYVAYRALKSNM